MGLESVGHTGAAAKGEDVVCAAVSTLVHTLVLGLETAGLSGVIRDIDPSVPIIRVEWKDAPAGVMGRLDLLTRTIAGALREISAIHADHVGVSEVHLK